MPPLGPEQASFLLQVALPQLKNEHRITRRVLETIPEDASTYTPHSACRTAFEIAWHTAAVECMILDGVASGQFHYGVSQVPEQISKPADIVAWYDENFAKQFDRVAALSGEQLTQPVDFHGMFKLPAVFYLQFAMNHSIHHRGQLSVYLRPMGAKVPSMYGPSGDESVTAATTSA
jgi:uncharacterized damage-inducible protein DinB